MWGVSDLFKGFAVGFSTFRNTEVGMFGFFEVVLSLPP